MESLWNEVRICRKTHVFTAQALVEGDIPCPEGREGARLVDCCGSVHIQECLCEGDSVSVSGTVQLEILGEGEGGELFSFASRAPFRHSLQAAGVHSGMEAQAGASLQSLDMQSGGRLRALVNLDCRVVDDSPLRLFAGLREAGDLQLERLKLLHSRRRRAGTANLRVRGEAAVPGVQSVIRAGATAAVRDIQNNGDSVEINGILRLKALCRSGDGRLFQAEQHLPFSETVEGDFPPGPLTGEIEVLSAAARSVGEEFGILAAEAKLSCRLFSREERELSLPLDAYSPTVPFECTREALSIRNFAGEFHARESLLENIPLPEGMAEVSRVVYATARPLLTGSAVAAEEGKLELEGVLFCRILYLDGEGKLWAFGTELPYSLEESLPVAGDEAVLCLQADCSASGAGRSVELSCSLHISGEIYANRDAAVVTAVAPCAPPRVKGGLVLCFAGEGESLFSIAKRYNTTREKLLALDPGLPPILKEGQQVLLLL